VYDDRGSAQRTIVNDQPSILAAADAEDRAVPPVGEEPDAASVTPGATDSQPAAIAWPLGFAENEPQHLDPAYVEMGLISNWIVTGITAAGAAIGLASAALSGLHGGSLLFWTVMAVAGVSALSWWGRRYTYLEHARTSYAVSRSGMEIRRGVVWRKVINVPRSRIQHTDVTQGPLQRAFGLSTLVLYTAGTEHAKIDLNGLAFETAMAIRHYLMERGESLGVVCEPPPADPRSPEPSGVEEPSARDGGP
jgi:uncharacterized protein